MTKNVRNMRNLGKTLISVERFVRDYFKMCV